MGRGSSKLSGNSGGSVNTNYKGQTEEEWNASNDQIQSDFDKWLDSNDKKAFEADQYSVFEKLSLNETQKYLKPDSEKGFSYNDSDEVPEDNWWHIEYGNGQTVNLEPGDSLKGVKRSDISFAINENAETTMIYSKKGSGYIGIYNDATFSENNDIWRWERK